MPTPKSGEKTMSSRLLTMKFMQRAAASNAQSDVSPKSGSAPGTPTPAEPPSKRRKTAGTGAGADSPSTPSDLEAVRAAIATENAKRDAVLERKAQESGDRWVLDFADAPPPAPQENGDPSQLQVRSAGFAELDGDAFAKRLAGSNWESEEDGESEEEKRPSGRGGRMVFGKYKSKDVASEADEGSSSEESSLDDHDEGEKPSEHRTAREKQKQKQNREANKLAQERRSRQVNLNKLTSISGGGNAGAPKKGSGGGKNVECFRCGKKGHTKANCPSGRK